MMQPPTPPPGPPGGTPGQWQPHGPPGSPPRSSLAVAAFVLALLGFVVGLFPFAGLIGTIGLVLAVVELRRPPTEQKSHRTLAILAAIFGALATAGVGIWLIITVSLGASIAKGSCPHVYAFDGEGYRLDADPLSGALYAMAERDDLDRMESLRAVNGEYRLRIAAELQEVDHVDTLELHYVDHPAGVEVLPTQRGELYAVRDARAPLRAESAGEDVLPLLAAEDGRTVTGAFPAKSDGDPRVVWTLDFERPASDRALLVVRGHSTAFAEAAFGQYMATMGRGVRPLVEWAEDKDCACSRAYVDEEIERLGFPLWVQTSTSPTGPWTPAPALQPVGPAIARSQALPIALPPGNGHVFVRIEATPQFWEIDQVALAPAPEAPLAPRVLHARSAVLSSGADVTRLLAARDGEHVVLHRGEHVDVQFDAPAQEGGERTVVAAVRGYYEMDIGGKWGINPATLIGHRLGVVSLPRFAAELSRKQASR